MYDGSLSPQRVDVVLDAKASVFPNMSQTEQTTSSSGHSKSGAIDRPQLLHGCLNGAPLLVRFPFYSNPPCTRFRMAARRRRAVQELGDIAAMKSALHSVGPETCLCPI